MRMRLRLRPEYPSSTYRAADAQLAVATGGNATWPTAEFAHPGDQRSEPVTSLAVETDWLSTRGGSRRVRIAAPVLGGVAALLMVVVGCTSVTDGSPTVDAKDVPVYRASMSASIEASVAASSALESESQASLTTQAVHSACEALSQSSDDAITAINDYVVAFNENTADASAKAGPAVDSLNKSADLVSSSISDAMSPDVEDALNGWVDAAKAVATAISGNYSEDEFNSAINRLNDSKTHAVAICDAAY
jgi:hypothetical protein